MTTASSQARITEQTWDDAAAEDAAEKASAGAGRAGAEVLYREMDSRVPVDTGTLKGTGEIAGEGADWAVGYGTEYGPVLMGHPEWSYQGGRSGRWMTEAIEAASQNVGRAMEEGARSEWPA